MSSAQLVPGLQAGIELALSLVGDGHAFTVPSCTECTEKEKEATGGVASN